MKFAAHARDAGLVAAVAWFGGNIIANVVLGWKSGERSEPIALGEVVVLLTYLAWVLGCVGVMVAARRRVESGWGWSWFFLAFIVSPPIAWGFLWIKTRHTTASWNALKSRALARLKEPTTVAGVLGLVLLVGVAT
jgi:hypothetical protein